MKKILLVFCIMFILSLTLIWADNPYRYSKEVNDATKGYSADYIVSPDEEPSGDQKVSNAPECDITAVISCYDNDQIRIDILLGHSISYDFTVWYAVAFEYSDSVEYYTYYPVTNELIYELEEGGKITKKEQLGDDSKDFAGITSAADKKSGSVYIIIDKDAHIGGDKGKKYYLATTFYSGFINDKNEFKIADKTITVDLEFKK